MSEVHRQEHGGDSGYIAEHPELKRPFYHVPHREGVAGTAAQFILHVSDRMDKRHAASGALASACMVSRLRTPRNSQRIAWHSQRRQSSSC